MHYAISLHVGMWSEDLHDLEIVKPREDFFFRFKSAEEAATFIEGFADSPDDKYVHGLAAGVREQGPPLERLIRSRERKRARSRNRRKRKQTPETETEQ
jgi:hypothetical protein